MLSKIISNLSDALDDHPISIKTAFSELSALQTANVEIRVSCGSAALTFIDGKLIGVQYEPKQHITI